MCYTNWVIFLAPKFRVFNLNFIVVILRLVLAMWPSLVLGLCSLPQTAESWGSGHVPSHLTDV